MSSAAEAKIEYEAGQTFYPMSALVDSGDMKIFDSIAALWSRKSGFEPTVLPDGLITGGDVIPATGNDLIDVAALTAYITGIKKTVAGSVSETVTRAATLTHQISSVTATDASAIAIIAGTEGSAFSEVRGDPGGPPYIPVDSVEIAQVRLAVGVGTPAPVAATEIFSVIGIHRERWDFPTWSEDDVNAQVEFVSALPEIHTGDLPKGVFASYFDPIFTEVPDVTDFVPPETSHSVSSTQIYQKTLGTSSKTLNQGSFTLYAKDNITDPIIGQKDQNLWFRYHQDKLKTPHILCQGVFGITRANPADNLLTSACTISANVASIEVAA